MSKASEVLLTKAEVGRHVSQTRQAISEACLRGALKPAVVGGKVNIRHPAAVRWLAERGVDASKLGFARAPKGAQRSSGKPRAPIEPPEPVSAAPPPEPGGLGPENVEELYELTFKEIAERFGSKAGFGDWIDWRKKVAETRRIELHNHETDGSLIPRELVATHVFGAINGVNLRLLRDAPKTIVRRIYALARSDVPIEEAEAVVRDLISAQLAASKAQATRVLRGRSKRPTTQDGEQP